MKAANNEINLYFLLRYDTLSYRTVFLLNYYCAEGTWNM